VAQLSEITSTEKLLKLIRSKRGESPDPVAGIETGSKKSGDFHIPMPKLNPLQKSSTIGIDIGHNYLRMIRATETSSGNWQIDDRKRFTLPVNTPKDSPEFRAFLKAALSAICGPAGRYNLWVIMSAARVEVRHIRIPKVEKKQISNAIYWTARKEAPFDEKETIFDFELQGELIDQGITKLAAMVYTAPRQEVEDLKDLFSHIGRPLTGISIVPFSLQNLFRAGWISIREGAVASLFIGIDFSRIDIYSGNNLVMTRGIKAGMGSMVEALVDRYNELNRNTGIPALTMEEGRNILRSLDPESPPIRTTDAGYALEKDDIFEMLRPALERLVRQVERTVEYYAASTTGDRISRIFVSGAMNIYPPIIEYVGTQLGMTSEILDPLSEFDPDSCMEMDDRNCIAERIACGPALGIAFSGNDHTPNMLFTYKDKEREASISRINMAVFAVFMIVVLICSGVFVFQNNAIAQKKKVIAGIESRLADIGPKVDRAQLMEMVAKVNQRRQLSKVYGERYLGMVLISEIVELTPAKIKLIDLRIDLGPVLSGTPGGAAGGAGAIAPGGAPKVAGEAPKPPQEEVVLEGLILGERQLFETSLAGYVMALEASPLFRQVTVQKSSVEPFVKDETLHFIIKMIVEAKAHG
jgi:Tfp pilus assembly PilM family ATPase